MALDHPDGWTRQPPTARDGLLALAEIPISVVVVSNADGLVEARLALQRLCQVGAGDGLRVAAVLDSSVVGVAKPDPAIFELAIEASGVARERTVHVGDSVAVDVLGAQGAGIVGVHFDPFGLCRDEGHAHVSDLRDLRTLVDDPAGFETVTEPTR